MSASCFDSHLQENKEQDPFDKLPDELIVQIFSHLSPEEIACRIAKVCLRWQSIAKEPALWQCSSLAYNELKSLEFQETILFAPSIAEVHINMFRNISDNTIKSMLSGCKSITYLSFYPGPEVPVNDKLNILSHYQENVIELNMFIDDSYLVCSDTTKAFCEIFGRMNNLKSLTLRGLVSSVLFEGGIFQNGLAKLESLDISNLGITFPVNESTYYQGSILNPWQNFILRILDHKAQNMKKLSLPEGVFDLSTVNALENKVMCMKIEELRVCEIGLRAVRKLDCIRVLHVVGLSLRNLDYLHKSAGSQYNSLYKWIADLPQFSNVRELSLEKIIDDERKLTSHLLEACRNLDSLTISSGCHTSAQLAHIISQLPSLKKLSMHRMSCLKSKHLEVIMFYLPNLVILNLRNNTLTDGILQFYVNNIQEKMPNLKLVCDWGYWSINGGSSWRGPSKSGALTNSFNTLTRYATSSECLSHDRATVTQMLDALTDYEDDD